MSGDQAPSRPQELNAGFDHFGRILPRDMVTGRLVAAARAMLDWDQLTLAERAGIRRHTLADLEKDGRRPQARVRDAVLGVLDAEGVRFVEMAGAQGVVLDLSSKQS